MYNQQERSLLRQKFWISFGKYMAPVPSVSGEKINWINYKTGVKSIHFKMDVDHQSAYIAIELWNKDFMEQKKYFDTFMSFRQILQDLLLEDWEWQENAVKDHSQSFARIFKTLPAVNLFRAEDWPVIIPFLKNRIQILDKFWVEYKDIFHHTAG